MLDDIRAVIWKEMRDNLGFSFRSKEGLSALLTPVLLAVITACAGKAEWLHPVMVLIFALFIPAFYTSAVVADSFAGERERKTLEALLATRLGDSAILFGKLGAMTLWAWAAAALFFAVGLLAVNVVARGMGVLFFGVPALVAAFAVAPLTALAAASLGMHYSLRASTVRQAQTWLGFTVMGLLMVPGIALRMIPAGLRNTIIGFVTGIDPLALVISTALFLLAESLVTVHAARARFRRARLILD
ncbi:ABC transporter permease subunit [bacterium]|nr:ABC transporter permease subunit [bacterium]